MVACVAAPKHFTRNKRALYLKKEDFCPENIISGRSRANRLIVICFCSFLYDLFVNIRKVINLSYDPNLSKLLAHVTFRQ